MTPSNPTNSQPLIYRIADALGVFHLVAPVNHTHPASEIEGLPEALAAKANAVPAGSPTGGIVIANTAGELSRSSKTVTDLENAIAAKQDALTFDSAPTTGSTNPVTSGGVAVAIKDARKVILNSNIPYVLSVAEKGVLYTSLFTNRTGAAVSLSECFDISGLPTAERNIFFNVAADSTEIANNETFGVRFLRTTSGVFVWYDGLFEF